MSVNPVISVLMPVFNTERYVAEAVESVLAQTFANFEFIIIDDGSTDRSLAILQRYAERDPRIRLISRPNTGYVIALNEMVEQARGEFVARMDADDICLPGRFDRQLAFMRENIDHIAVGSAVLLVDADGDPLRRSFTLEQHEEIDRAHLACTGGSAIIHPTLLARRESLVNIGGYRVEFQPAEDLDLFLRLAECGRLANLPDVLLKYRRHPSAIGYKHRHAQIAAVNGGVQAAYRRRGLSFAGKFCAEESSQTIADQHRTWAWWALGAGFVKSARKHALLAIQRSPWSLASWRTVYCAFRGY